VKLGHHWATGQPHLVFELLVLCHRPMIIVRGTPADFAEVDTWPLALEGRRG
jgi:hypothetical protein